MNVHKNARLTAHSRAELVRRVLEGQPRKLVAEAFGVDPKTGTKWVNRYLADGPSGLADRSSRPHRLRKPIPDETRQQIIASESCVSRASRSRGRPRSRQLPSAGCSAMRA